ncbi:pitrilysin family protein [Rhodohalobacter sp. SW132]|nr:pitrilysin family protein [Rhodohalobacter sp. SW132]
MKQLSILCMMLLFAASCATQEQATQQSAQPVDVNSLEYPDLNPYQIPDIETFELDNGITFYLVEDDEVPLINLNMIVRAGSFMEPAEKVGLSSIMTNAMRNGGSEAYPEEELNQLLEDRAARIEFGMGRTSGSASLNVLKEDFNELLPVLVDVMTNPLMPQEKIDLAIRQQRSGISRRNDDAQQVGFREFQKLIYGEDSPQARVTELYTLDEITRDDLIEFHSKAYTGENLMIGLVGDFKVEEIRPLLEEAFADIPAGERNELEFDEIDYEFEPSIHFVDKRDVNQSVVLMGHIGGFRDNPDYAALQAMNEVLSGGFSGRLFQNVRSDQGLAYSVFGNYGSSALYRGQFYAGVFTRSEATAEAIEAVRNEMKKLQDEPVSTEELEDTRNSILNSLVFRTDSRSSVLNQRMSNEYLGLPADAFETYIEELREITPEDIQRVAREYMRPEEMKILVVGNGAELGDQLEQFGTVQEVDITIRETLEEEEVIAGDAAAGRDWLDRMATAVISQGDLSGDLIFEADNTVNTPQGEMVMEMRQTINFASEKLISEISAPFGQVTMRLEDGEGRMVMGGNEMPMQPQQKEQVLAELYRNHIYLALNKDDLDVDFMGMEEISGNQYAHIRINDEIALNLYLDPDTNLPMVTTYRQFDPQAGETVTVRIESADWRESSGVMMPYEMIGFSGDTQQSRTVIQSHHIE